MSHRNHRPLEQRRPVRRHERPLRRRHQPRHRTRLRPGRPGLGRRRRGRHRGRRRGRAGVGAYLPRAAYAGAVRVPRAAELPPRRAGGDHHLRARQGALGRPRRDRARPGGRGVRVRHLAPAQGRPLRERLDRRRRALQARPAGRGRHHLAVQLPGDGADVVLPDRHRGRQHRRPQAQREGPVRGRCGSRGSGRRPVSPTASSTCSRATRRRSTHCCRARWSRRSASSARRRSPSTSTSRPRCTGSACRPWAAPRTTWSSSPTPTSTWPPTRPSTPASAARASAAWRSACWWPSARSATSSSPGSPTAPATSSSATAARPRPSGAEKEADMGPLVTKVHRDKVSAYIDSGQRDGAKVVVDGREVASAVAPRTASGSVRRCSTTCCRTWRSTARRSSARCCRWSASTPTTRPSSWSTATRTATGPRCSPTTAGPRGASRPTSTSA